MSMSLRDKLKDSKMRLVELASYLGISRPTLYRYLELYEFKEYNAIDKISFDLFTFIDNTENITRLALMDYLINKVVPFESVLGSDIEVISNVRKLSNSQNRTDIKKMKVIGALSSTNKFDDVIDILVDLLDNKTKVTQENLGKNAKKGGNKNG